MLRFWVYSDDRYYRQYLSHRDVNWSKDVDATAAALCLTELDSGDVSRAGFFSLILYLWGA